MRIISSGGYKTSQRGVENSARSQQTRPMINHKGIMAPAQLSPLQTLTEQAISGTWQPRARVTSLFVTAQTYDADLAKRAVYFLFIDVVSRSLPAPLSGCAFRGLCSEGS